MFEKYRLALTNPKRSPLAPLKKGGNPTLSPPLGALHCRGTRTVRTSAFLGGFRGIYSLQMLVEFIPRLNSSQVTPNYNLE